MSSSAWSGKARKGRYAKLVKAGAGKKLARRYSQSALGYTMYWELRAVSDMAARELRIMLWGEERALLTVRRPLTGLRGIVATVDPS